MKGIVTGFLAIFLGLSIYAQKTVHRLDVNQHYLNGLKLYEQGLYMNAQREFEVVMTELPMNADIAMNSQYYSAVCGLELFHKEADDLLISYLDEHPQSTKSHLVKYQLGKYYYRRKNYARTIEWLKKVDKYDLKPAELEEYYFKLGYSYFAQRKKNDNYLELAQGAFYEVKSSESIYSSLAIYYHAHILYYKGKYESALQGFVKLKEVENFKNIIPYYIAQIYYHQKKYEELSEYATPLLNDPKTKRPGEIARMIGESYYRSNKYEKAVPYLLRYVESSSRVLDEDSYQLAYAQYRSGMYADAAKVFERLASNKNVTGQLSYYYLGDIFLKIDQKEKARIAFKYASNLEFDKELAENSLFNYAKLAYDLYDPYQEAIRSFELFIEKYPNSERITEAYKILLDVYVNTKNYTSALAALDKIEIKDLKLRQAYQKIAYSRGVELFNDQRKVYHEKEAKFNNLKSAIYYFEKSKEYPINPDLFAQANYWIAESHYRQGNYTKAIELFNKFKFSPGIINLQEYKDVDYNLAYSFYKIALQRSESIEALRIKEYDQSIEWFRKYVQNNLDTSVKVNDAYLRIADAYFMQEKFQYAIDFYQEAVTINLLNSDYALMQMAQAYGVNNKNEQKIETLNKLVASFPESTYMDDAYFLLGETNFSLGKNEKAREYYQILVSKRETVAPRLVQSSFVRMALIDYQNKDYQSSISAFKEAVEVDQKNDIAQQALKGLKEAYTKVGDSEAYYSWYAAQGLPPISDSEKDEFLFEVGREQYLENKYADASVNFSSYIDQFPNGQFILDVNYFKADCHLSLKQFDKAIKNYEFVISQPQGDYTEDAVLQSARIYLAKKDWDNVIYKYLILEDISDYYENRLEARIGLMRAYYESGNKGKSAVYAGVVASNSKVPNEVKYEAHLTMGRCALADNNLDKAMTEFSKTVSLTKSELGAEAKYSVAYVYFLQGDYTESKKNIVELAKQIPTYKYWITKGFILLSDIYVAKNDLFHAKHTLKLVLDNNNEEELRNIALSKLEDIEDLEMNESVEELPDDWSLDFEGEEVDSTLIENE